YFWSAKGAGELATRVNIELAVCVTQVHLDGLHAQEQRLGDLPVGEPFVGHRRDPPLTRGQCIAAGRALTARPRSAREQLRAGALGDQRAPAGARLIESVA